MRVTAARSRRAGSASMRAGVELVEVLDCWLGIDHRYFKMLATWGNLHPAPRPARERWELTMSHGRPAVDGAGRSTALDCFVFA